MQILNSSKKSPMYVVIAAHAQTVAILNCNTPAFYCVPAELYEYMIEQLEDLKLNAIAKQKPIRVNINDL